MNQIDSSTIIDRYYALLASRNRPDLLALLDDEICVRYYGPDGLLPWIGEFNGKRGYEEFFDIIATHLDIVEVETLDRVSDERKTVVQCRGCWRVRANGNEVVANMINVFSVVGGKVSEYEVYNDTAAFAAAMYP